MPLTLVGMGAERMQDGAGEVPQDALPGVMARHRFFFNPIRYTSLGLSIVEAMFVGMPIVGLATTELPTIIVSGENGYVDTRIDRPRAGHAARRLPLEVKTAEHAMASTHRTALPAGIAALVLAGVAAAQGTSAPSRGDVAFMEDAARAGLAEIQGSKLAVEKAVNTQVRGYAQQMVDEHTQAHEALAALAAQKGVKLPTEPSLAQRAKLELLASADGAAFDRRYADTLGLATHRDTVRMFQKAAAAATDPDVKAYAAKTLPALQHHLQMAGELKTVTAKEGNAKALHDKKQ